MHWREANVIGTPTIAFHAIFGAMLMYSQRNLAGRQGRSRAFWHREPHFVGHSEEQRKKPLEPPNVRRNHV
jgi:hypothetical protein